VRVFQSSVDAVADGVLLAKMSLARSDQSCRSLMIVLFSM